MARKRISPIPPTEYLDDGIFRDPVPQVLTPELWAALEKEWMKERFTFRQWLGDFEAFIAGELDKYLTEEAKGVVVLNEKHLVPDAPPVTRDLLNAWMNCKHLDAARGWNAEGVFSFQDVLQAYYLGCAIQRIKVRPLAPFAKIGKTSREGAAKGQATKASKAAQRREATQLAVRDRWTKNPKLSLSAIQQALAKVDGKPFGSQSLIEKNTVGMKPAT